MPQIKKSLISQRRNSIFSRYSESQLFHINEPKPGIFIAESPNVIERALNAGYEPLAVPSSKKTGRRPDPEALLLTRSFLCTPQNSIS